jgi:pre-mRNA-splicing factor RBM22/SLT11
MASSTDPRLAGVEASEFPILCETCLGPNPYVRMIKDKWGRPCKVCDRPFTVFRWNPAGPGSRYKNTQVCQTCARVKNVCQTCVLDLTYGLPVQVRDATMAPADRQALIVPSSDTTRQYAAAQGERAIATGAVDAVYAAAPVNDIAEKNKRVGPRYDRNRARLCTMFAKGQCTRGLYCQFRHELPVDKENPLAKQNIKDRFYGVNDPVAAGILARSRPANTGSGKGRPRGPPEPPEDHSITSLFIGGLTPTVTEQIVRAVFGKHRAGLSNVRVLGDKGIAFVDFATREQAEAAIADKHGRIEVADAVLSINWAKGGGGGSGREMRGAPSCGGYVAGPGPALADISGLVPGVQAPPPQAVVTGVDGLGAEEPAAKRKRGSDDA